MAAVELIPLSRANISLLEATFRPEDEAECLAIGWTAAQAARSCVSDGENSYAVYCEGALCGFAGYKCEGLFGPCDLWLLTTPAVEDHKKTFVRFARAAVAYLHQCHRLRVVVAKDYSRALRLAGSLGFRFGPATGGFVFGVTD